MSSVEGIDAAVGVDAALQDAEAVADGGDDADEAPKDDRAAAKVPAFVRAWQSLFVHVNVQACAVHLRTAAFRFLAAVLASPRQREHALGADLHSLSTLGGSPAPAGHPLRFFQLARSQQRRRAASFAAGVVLAAEGERDPRALFVCLEVVRRVLEHPTFCSSPPASALAAPFADASGSGPSSGRAALTTPSLMHEAPIVSDLFDITSVYFPISFTPPKGRAGADSQHLTRGALVTRLRALLTASDTPQVHSLLAPLCMEKLTSSVDNARWDAAETLAVVVRGMRGPMLAKYAPSVAEAVCKLLASAASAAGQQTAKGAAAAAQSTGPGAEELASQCAGWPAGDAAAASAGLAVAAVVDGTSGWRNEDEEEEQGQPIAQALRAVGSGSGSRAAGAHGGLLQRRLAQAAGGGGWALCEEGGHGALSLLVGTQGTGGLLDPARVPPKAEEVGPGMVARAVLLLLGETGAAVGAAARAESEAASHDGAGAAAAAGSASGGPRPRAGMVRVLREVVAEVLSWALAEVADNPRGRNGRLAAAAIEVLLACDPDVAAVAAGDVAAAMATHVAAVGRQPVDAGAAGALGCVDAASALRLAGAVGRAGQRQGSGLAVLAAGRGATEGARAGAAARRLVRGWGQVAGAMVSWRSEGQASRLAALAERLAGKGDEDGAVAADATPPAASHAASGSGAGFGAAAGSEGHPLVGLEALVSKPTAASAFRLAVGLLPATIGGVTSAVGVLVECGAAGAAGRPAAGGEEKGG